MAEEARISTIYVIYICMYKVLVCLKKFFFLVFRIGFFQNDTVEQEENCLLLFSTFR